MPKPTDWAEVRRRRAETFRRNRVLRGLPTAAETSSARRAPPYGILPGQRSIPTRTGRPFKVRDVTFGCARWMDAMATFFTDRRIELHSSRHGVREFGSVEALIAQLREDWNL